MFLNTLESMEKITDVVNEKIPDVIDASWHPYLQPLFNDPKMKIINNKKLPDTPKFYPEPKDIFRVFSMPIDKIKVVIIGQDPYPNGEAIGYAFAVKSSFPLPGSLKVIKNEIIRSKVERDSHTYIESDKWKTLSHWVQQGIFLLNSALTVEAKSQGSHLGLWQWFTREVIKIISSKTTVKPTWLLWGAKAHAFRGYIESGVVWTKNNSTQLDSEISCAINYVLTASHPAAELYPGSTSSFTGCNCFNLCNQILKAKDQTIINW